MRKALHQRFPFGPKVDLARQLATLALIVRKIVAGPKSQIPALARKVPDESHPDSRAKRMIRRLDTGRFSLVRYYLPLALALDASEVGRGCRIPSVVRKKRASPLVWTDKKGHASEEEHLEWPRIAKAILPEGRRVIFLGDGKLDGIELQAALRE
jgi:hypothetical protein